MQSLKHWFLEDPTALYISLGIAQIILLVLWHQRRSSRLLKLLAVPLVLAGGLFLLDHYIVTDREQLIENVEAIARHVENGRLDQAMQFVDENYRGFGGSRENLLKMARQDVRMETLRSVKIAQCAVNVNGRQATMDAQSVIKLGGSFEGTYALSWRLYWIKRPGGWRIEEIRQPTYSLPGLGI